MASHHLIMNFFPHEVESAKSQLPKKSRKSNNTHTSRLRLISRPDVMATTLTVFGTDDVSAISFNECLLSSRQRQRMHTESEYVSVKARISPTAAHAHDPKPEYPPRVVLRVVYDSEPMINIENSHVRFCKSKIVLIN